MRSTVSRSPLLDFRPEDSGPVSLRQIRRQLLADQFGRGQDVGAAVSPGLTSTTRLYLDHDGTCCARVRADSNTWDKAVRPRRAGLDLVFLSRTGCRISVEAEAVSYARHHRREVVRVNELVPETEIENPPESVDDDLLAV